MKKISQSLCLLILALIMTRAWPAQADEFYAERLRAGKDSYRAKHFREAADQLRIAAFGFLDDPPLLSESLARLALAQAAIQPPADFGPTLTRFLDVERRFTAFARAQLELDLRAEFQALLTQHVPSETLSEIPSLSGMVETPDQKIAKLSPKEQQRALETAAEREPKAVKWPLALCRIALDGGDAKMLQKWADRTLAIEPENREALADRAHAFALRGNCEKAFADLRSLSKEDFDKWPMLFADDFVCLAAKKDWPGAAEALSHLPADAASRKDVELARAKLAKAQADENAKLAKAQADENSKLAKAHADEKARLEKSQLEERGRVGNESEPQTPPPSSPPVDSPRPVPDLSESRKLLLAGKAGEAEKQIRAIVKAEPRRRDSRLALLEAACLAKDWSVAGEQIPLILPFKEGEEPFEFYAAVVLFETGHLAEARKHLERARPRIMATPYTDYYSRKILGT